jgi:hypothetical protein
MKWKWISMKLVVIQLFSGLLFFLMAESVIVWGDRQQAVIKHDTIELTKGLRLIGSFSLEEENQERIGLRGHGQVDTSKPFLLIREGYTVHILDVQRVAHIGRFSLPETGTPDYIELQADASGKTMLITKFRMLPPPGTIGRPGPLIEQFLVFKDGRYTTDQR